MLSLAISLCYKELHLIHINDIHGWIYGHKDNPLLGDLSTVLSYYERVKQNISQNPNASVMLVNSGDDCEGTGLSGLSDPPCKEIYDFLWQIPFDLMIVGNHDQSHGPSMDYLYSKLHQGYDKITMPFVTTNNIYTKTNQTFGDYFKYQVLSNGIRALMFGFMYSSANMYPATYVIELNEIFSSPQFQSIITEYANVTDIVLLNCHISTLQPENDIIYKYFRNFFQNFFNYSVPIHVFSGHFHATTRIQCAIHDNNCLNTETASKLQKIEHIVWELKDQTVTLGNFTFKGSSAQKVTCFPFNHLIVENSSHGEGLAKRFNVSPLNFDTVNALQLRVQILKKCKEMNLSQIVAFSKFKYPSMLNTTFKESLKRLYTFSLSPAIVINRQLEKTCCQFTITKQDLVRVDLQQGLQTLDDVYIVLPYLFDMAYLHQLTPMQARCVFDWVAWKPWDWTPSPQNEVQSSNTQNSNDKQIIYGDPLGMFPFYVIPNDTWDQQCYDIVTDVQEGQRMQLAYEKCGMSGPELNSYPTSSGVNRTDKLWLEYVQRYMQNQTLDMSNSNKYFTENEITINIFNCLWGLISLIVAALIIANIARLRENSYQAEEDGEM